jgi:hypothetical protein
MRKSACGLTLLLLASWLQEARAVSQYHYDWQCVDQDCSFSASPVANVLAYEWDFGDVVYAAGTGQNVTHSYDFPGSGHMTTRVTLSYHFTNGTYRNVRCYIEWDEIAIGGWPGPDIYGGTCEGFH